ncbi:hypothetical protein J0X14_14230 [Muricauda sp. CAU 1633]|uniref:hypothetical protein n=1 Tax=Allomuricauda sp. CAU 1633 TaxID=2816036 RepID=UPI001A8CC4BE|nr:hypothetical protein [Muricauda sp. CAU 1633]MBO0323462.1 hypothetical protein [Muricauda sp. CAU 1633]
MATVLQVQKRISPLTKKSVLETIAFQELKKLREVLIKLQKERLDKGLDTSGKVIGTYSFSTEIISKSKNPIKPKKFGQPYNFQDSGDFFKGMELLFKPKEAVFISKDSKQELLTSKYDDLMGYTDEQWIEFLRTKLQPAFMKEFRNRAKL